MSCSKSSGQLAGLLCLALTPFTVNLAQAQEALAAVEAAGIEQIVVVGRWEDPVGASLSASSGVFGQQEILERPMLRTGELLEFVPGLILTQHSGSGKSNQMFLRGFNLDHGTDFATWVDGMPVNMRTHGHGQGYTDINFLIEELVERVEFVKGPVDARIGDFSSAGAALMRTTRLLDEGFVKGVVGQNGFVRTLAADSIELGSGALLIGGEARFYDGPWDDIDEDLEAYKGLLRYSAETGAGDLWDVAFMAYDASWNSADQIPRRAVEQGLISDLGSLDTTVGGDTSRYSLSASWLRQLDDRRWRARGYVIDYQLNLLSNFTYFLDDPFNGDQFQQVDDRTIYGGDLSLQLGDAASAGQMQQTFGAEFRYDDIGEVALNRTVAAQFLDTVRQDQVKQGSVGLYYENRYAWTDKLRSVLGVRYDYYDFDVSSNLAANSGAGDDALISPKLSLIYGWSEDTEFYANAGYGMHSNDARGVTITVDPVTGDPTEQVDALVRSKGAELGGRTFITEKLNVALAVWYLDLDSELLFVGDAGNTEALGPSRRYGVEIPVYYKTEYWKFDLELSLTNSEFSETGEEIPGSLDRVVAAGAYFDYPQGWYGAARVRHFGDRPLIEDGSVKSSPTTVVNTMLGYRFGRDAWDVRGELLNVLDSNDDDITYFYESRLRVPFDPTGALEPAGVGDVHFRRVEPRTFRVSITYNF
jgi:outer membrane receptor protein involved in Fe transport